jgi:hypothetical protein
MLLIREVEERRAEGLQCLEHSCRIFGSAFDPDVEIAGCAGGAVRGERVRADDEGIVADAHAAVAARRLPVLACRRS